MQILGLSKVMHACTSCFRFMPLHANSVHCCPCEQPSVKPGNTFVVGCRHTHTRFLQKMATLQTPAPTCLPLTPPPLTPIGERMFPFKTCCVSSLVSRLAPLLPLILSWPSSGFDMWNTVSGPSKILLLNFPLFQFVLLLYIACTFKRFLCDCLTNLMVVVRVKSQYVAECRLEARIPACSKRQQCRTHEAPTKRC